MAPRVHFTRRTVVLVRSTSAPYAANNSIVDGTPLTLSCDNFGVLYTRPAPGGPALPGGGSGPVPVSQSATSNPGLGVVASASVPASGGIFPFRNVASTISWSAGDTAATAFVALVLRDGASGVGPILWQKEIGPIPAGQMASGDITFSDTGAPFGTSNTAMTLEFLAAPAGTGRQSVSLTTRAGN